MATVVVKWWKARRDAIEARYTQALELAKAALPEFKQQAKDVYSKNGNMKLTV